MERHLLGVVLAHRHRPLHHVPLQALAVGIGRTLALAVNALFIIGLFSMLYGFVPFNLEVNQAFIAAILTIIAMPSTIRWSLRRIREYLGLYPKRNLKDNVNNAINSTLSRTINTSGTTLVTLLAIFFFGGETSAASSSR